MADATPNCERARTVTACTICQHPKRAQIEIALTYGIGAPAIAQRFGVSKDALHRHRSKHLSAATRAAVLAGSQRPSGVDLERLKVSEAEGCSLASW